MEANFNFICNESQLSKVNENDHLPKRICLDCWNTVERFHEFYNTVNETKRDFLLNFVKHEEPDSMVTDGDFVECDTSFLPVKLEPSVGIVVSELKMPSLEDNPFEDDYVAEDTKSILGKDDDDTPFRPSDDKDFSNDCDSYYDDNESQSDSNVQKLNDEGVHELLQGLAKETGNDLDTTKNQSDKFDHLISSYIDMQCEKCQYPFSTLLEARSHYRSAHNQRSVLVKCCQRRLSMPVQLRDHIKYHLNPDTFK